MLPQRKRSSGRYLLRVMGAVLAAAPVLCFALPARAADNATELVPADAAFFTASLRNREQYDAVVKSKAFKRLKDLPLVKEALKKFKAEKDKKDGPFAKFYEDKDNKALVELVIEAGSSEVFLYGGAGWPELLNLVGQVQNASQFAGLADMLGGGDGTKAQARAALRLLQKNKAIVKVPDLVFGFKIKDAKKANAQIKRLEKLLTDLEPMAPPELKGKLKRTKVGESTFLTFNLDGSMIPWDEIPLKDVEEKAGEFDDIVKHVKGSKLTVSLGVREGYLLLAITSTAADLLKIGGKGPKLIGRDELKPLVKNGKKPLTSIAYVSKKMNRAGSGSPGDLDSLASSLKGLLAKAKLPEAKKKAIEKDLEDLAKDLKKYAPEPGAALSFEYVTENGYEGWGYDYSGHAGLKGAHLKLLDHFGGNPIFAAGIGTKSNNGEGYATFAKWTKVVYGHAEDLILPNLDADQKTVYDNFTTNFFPLFRKLDATTSKLLLPALKDGSIGLVVDAKWTSKRWHKDAPPLPKAMPMLELGLLLSLSDSAKFQQAMKAYRTTFNEMLEKAREVSKDNVPEIKIPVPDSEKTKAGTLYTWKLPEPAGLDEQVLITAGVSKSVAVLTLSKAHAERLLKKTPLAIKSGPLVEHKKDLVAGCYFSGPAFIDALAPWVEFGVSAALLADENNKLDPKDVVKQLKTALDVLKAFQSYSSASYLEDGVRVTHTETVIKDR